jgi:iron(III) transport system permease protein
MPSLPIAGGIALLTLLPLAMLALTAVQGAGPLWGHLARYVLPEAAGNTLLLLAGVGLVAGSIGTVCAWLVTLRDFPLRRLLSWALLLPMAVPTYIVAYAYLDLLHPLGPLHGALRALLPAEVQPILPDPRSLPGCAVLLGLVLYPYVYLNLRAAFALQSGEMLAAGRSLGGSEWQLLRFVSLPLARPALAVGLSLVLLEALNDIGASEYLGVQTLTLAISTTWVTRSSAPGAAQLALLLLGVAALLMWLEWRSRGEGEALAAEEIGGPGRPPRLRGAWGIAATVACALPVVLGFLLPGGYLLHAAATRLGTAGLPEGLWRVLGNSLAFAGGATALLLGAGVLVAYAARCNPGRGGALLRLAGWGYGIPGTVMGFGLLLLLGRLDNALDGLARQWLGLGTGLVLSASGAAVLLAYLSRFLAIPAQGLAAGYGNIPRALDDAATLDGARAGQMLRRVHLPLLAPALRAVALLCFVDAMKELPATLLLRPLNVETLATALHGEAARGSYEDGAVFALLIVAVGVLPMLLLGRARRAAAG